MTKIDEPDQLEGAQQIDELRQILVGANADVLAQLKHRIESVENRTSDVAQVLSPAIDAGLKADGQALVDSLQAPVSLSLKQAIRAEPQEYAEILYPVMAPSIRRAISQAISSLLVTINRTVESATSAAGIKTRIQSIRTGVPYAELALRHSLLYRVEHVYLIDRSSGMLIDEATTQDSKTLDSDAVSAMFSAIQSFVQDSFSRDQSAMLTDLRVGEHNVWVAHGPSLMLACVILGDAPEGLKSDLYDALYEIRTNFGNQIANFDGDTLVFDGVKDYLQPLLQLQLKESGMAKSANVNEGRAAQKSKSISRWLPWLVVLGALAFLVYYVVDRDTQISTIEYQLRQAPGIAVTDVYWDGGKIIVEGLQDPDAQVPIATLEAYNIDPQRLVFKTIPFRSLEVSMELQRFRSELTLPAGVYLSQREGAVYLYGEAPVEWLAANGVRIRQLAADRRLTISALSASFESVSDLLRRNFDASDLSAIRMSSVARDDLTMVQIGGYLQANKLALMKALFAGSHWVDVSAKRKIEGSPAATLPTSN